MLRILAILTLLAAVAIVAPGGAGNVATCTPEQKAKAQRAADAYARAIPQKRRAYFKTHKSAAQRKAFVKAQQAKLRKLRASAACTVPPPPPPPGPVIVPTASSPCMLAPNQRATEIELTLGFPLFHEGPVNTAGALPTGGQVRAVVIAVDFPDVPATQDAAPLASTTVSGLGRFEEYSYGRFSVSTQIVPGWRRMPRPASSYASLSDGGDGARTFLSEATGVVDAEVDFSNVGFVFVLTPGMAPFQRAGNPAWSVFPGRGFTRDGNEIRHATTMMRAFTQAQQDIASTANHEVAHSLGLPEAYQQTSSGTRFDLVGMWDPMSQPNQHHFLAWHGYRLGWIEQGQITCIDSPRDAQATLTPLETRAGMKAIVVRTTPTQAYVVEARRKLGLDSNLCKEGVLVYTVDSQVENGGGPIRVQRAAEDVPGEERNRCDTLYNAPFQPGQTFEDASVKVSVLATTGSSYTVAVTRKG
ncbi:M6 family metalloprotease domain-containing protein [soil metagenome]